MGTTAFLDSVTKKIVLTWKLFKFQFLVDTYNE